MIGIRVDGNASLGTGHIMRCLSIAHQLRALGETPVFISTQNQPRVVEEGFDCIALGGSYRDLSEEELVFQINGERIHMMMTDLYFADEEYFERIHKKGMKLAVIFDQGFSGMHCDLLVDYNVNFEQFEFPHAVRTLLGMEYAPLRQEFCGVPERQYGEVRSILITAGGADPAGSTPVVLRALREEPALQGIQLDVVVGGMNPLLAKISEATQDMEGVVLHENAVEMSRLMRQADIVISAGGTTLYEICASGVPCVAYSIADNQDEMIAGMHGQKMMLSAGIWRADPGECTRQIVQQVKLLVQDQSLRASLGSHAKGRVDGRGAYRIAKEMVALCATDATS